MFFRYAYRKEKGQLLLYLYKTTHFEFAQEAINPKEEHYSTLEDEAIAFVKKKQLPLSFEKLYIVVDGNIIKTIPKEDFPLEEKQLKTHDIDETHFMICLKDENREEKISLFQYLIGTLFASTAFPLEKEALKALVILYRTYALEQIKEKGMIDAKNSFVIYKDPHLYKFSYLEQFHKTYQLYREVILETRGLYLLSNGQFIKPYVHLISSGKTTTNQKDSYLVSKDSLWDMKAKNYFQSFFFSYQDLAQKFLITKDNFSQYTKKDIAYLLGLPSLAFTCLEEKEGLTILSRGVGNDLGLSLFGANYLAKQGLNYAQILAYYFQNILLYRLSY